MTLCVGLLMALAFGACRDQFFPVTPLHPTDSVSARLIYDIWGHTWCLRTIEHRNTPNEPVPPESSVSMMMVQDGTLSGYTGCSPYRGGFVTQGSSLTASCKILPAGIDCLDTTYESRLIALLNGVRTYSTPRPDSLRVDDGAGNIFAFVACN